MNNVERMAAGLRYCADCGGECLAKDCPLLDMCVLKGSTLIGVLRIAAEMLDALVQQRDEWQRRAQDAEAQHRTEYCEAGPYDCVTLGKLRAELDLVKRERDALLADVKAISKAQDVCVICRHYDSEPNCDFVCEECGHGCMCAKCHNDDLWEWRGVQEERE